MDLHLAAPSHPNLEQWLRYAGRKTPQTQWRARSGFSPDSLFSPTFGAPRAILFPSAP